MKGIKEGKCHFEKTSQCICEKYLLKLLLYWRQIALINTCCTNLSILVYFIMVCGEFSSGGAEELGQWLVCRHEFGLIIFIWSIREIMGLHTAFHKVLYLLCTYIVQLE